MRTRCLWLTVAMFWVWLGCVQAEPSAKLKVVLDAVPSASPSASPLASGSPTPSRPTPPSVVPFRKLMTFLPKTPEGWASEKPNGSQTDIDVFLLSTASRTYQKGDDESALVATVTIIDAGGYGGYLDAITSQWKPNNSPDGVDRPVEIDGMPGFEHVTMFPKAVSLSVIVGKRFFVQIDLTNLEPRDAREWLKKMDLKGLAELK